MVRERPALCFRWATTIIYPMVLMLFITSLPISCDVDFLTVTYFLTATCKLGMLMQSGSVNLRRLAHDTFGHGCMLPTWHMNSPQYTLF